MTFYSGFSLREDRHFFDSYLKKSVYTVAGFSYGAMQALMHVKASNERIDTLQLFSPFFQQQGEKFRRLQMMGYKKDRAKYLQSFLQNSFQPYPQRETLHVKTNAEMLHELLYYEWSQVDLQLLVDRGIHIEIYLGEYDRISDVKGAKAFFLPFATTYWIKNANHFLLQE